MFTLHVCVPVSDRYQAERLEEKTSRVICGRAGPGYGWFDEGMVPFAYQRYFPGKNNSITVVLTVYACLLLPTNTYLLREA